MESVKLQTTNTLRKDGEMKESCVCYGCWKDYDGGGGGGSAVATVKVEKI
ncbi:conserved hypothetical protein [Ricinus communis]|uniref:Uncharacterized protein n=1 Tax=Ricinus communis TaxID=3988 RepID=B9T7Z7_RICCO|nr:conserved hypothetical protein [Ricinus communis]